MGRYFSVPSSARSPALKSTCTRAPRAHATARAHGAAQLSPRTPATSRASRPAVRHPPPHARQSALAAPARCAKQRAKLARRRQRRRQARGAPAHRRVVRLEARDGLWLAGLRHHVDGRADSAGHGQQLALLVQGHEHARLHGGGQAVEQVRLLAAQRGLDVEPRHEHRQQARQRHACAATGARARVVGRRASERVTRGGGFFRAERTRPPPRLPEHAVTGGRALSGHGRGALVAKASGAAHRRAVAGPCGRARWIASPCPCARALAPRARGRAPPALCSSRWPASGASPPGARCWCLRGKGRRTPPQHATPL